MKKEEQQNISKEEIIELSESGTDTQTERYHDALRMAEELEIVDHVMIQTVTTQMAFISIMQALEKGIYVIPGFQRMFRWSERQVENLAVSLVRGMPIPPIYCYRNKEQQIVILDGQQRLLSLYLYYIGKYIKRKKNAFIDLKSISINETSFRQRLEQCGLTDKTYYMGNIENNRQIDITYKNLGEATQRKINFMPITFIQINVDSNKHKEKTLHKIFANLNIGGTPLSGQELRNGIYSCKFYDMLYEVNDSSSKWRLLYSGNQNASINKESKDVELLLKMCAFQYFTEGTGEKFILSGYKGKISVLLGDFSEKAMEFDSSTIASYRDTLLSFFDCLESIKGTNKDLALISLFVVWNRLDKKPNIPKNLSDQIIAHDSYRETIQQGTSRKSEIEKRFRSVYEQLSNYDR